MSRLLAVTARELRERWMLFPAALVVGFFPIVLPAFGVERELMPTVGLVEVVLLGLAAAVVIGSSMLARDAANGRLGFLFSRPVTWPAIWGGKWLAALVLVAASGFLAAIPWMTVFPPDTHGGSWLRAIVDAPGAVFFLLLFFLAVGLANFTATAFRSRSAWPAIDLVLLLLAIWATRRYVAPLWRYGIIGFEAWNLPLPLPLLPLAVGLVGGSATQVAVGRTDLRRAHRALSLTFWAVAFLGLASAAIGLLWIRSAAPADVAAFPAFPVTRDPAGRWAYLEGHSTRGRLYRHRYLVDTTSGRYLVPRERDINESWTPAALFSADGRFAALPGSDREGRGSALALYALNGDNPRLTEVALESSVPPTWRTAFALSPSAAFAFVVHESGASLFALPSGRRAATTTITPGWRPAAVRFLAEGSARAWLVPASDTPEAARRAEIRVVDLSSDGATKAIAFPTAAVPGAAAAVVADGEGRRIVTVDGGLHLRDGATGELLATLAEGPGRLSAVFLADGRIVVGDGRIGVDEAAVRVCGPNGARLGEIRLGLRAAGLSVGPEVAPGRVVVSTFRGLFLAEESVLVDLGENRVVERLAGLRPALIFWGIPAGWVSPGIPAGAAPTTVHFFRDVEGRVIRIDFASGERRVVAGPGAPRAERLRDR